jgi:4-amino-4-deoxy-L-arabinose transferase-like glycosyltransferase
MTIVALSVVAVVAHGTNMFDYPASSLADDEGTYVQQAWAVLREGRLTPYTYTYDHVPGGWLQIAAWLGLVGPRAFGSVTETARVLMLMLHVAAVIFLYVAARRLGVRPVAASLSALVFAASPLALFYGREAILDNIMAFWLVLALALLAAARSARVMVLAGAALGVAILSKEPALVLIPAYALLAAVRAPRGKRLRQALAITVPAVALTSVYPLYALAQGQLWPTATGAALTASDPRAYGGSSLMDSIIWQLGRPGGNLLDPASRAHVAVRDWLHRDAALVLVGVASAIGGALRWRTDPVRGAIGVLAILSFGFLIRGGLVLGFHVPLAIPFLALNFGLGAVDLIGRLRLPVLAVRPALVSGVALVLCWSASGLAHLYLDRPGAAGRAAVAWIERSVPPDAVIVGRDDMWADLHEPDGATSFADFHTHWRLAYDADARRAVLTDGWRSLDYIVVTADLIHSIRRTTHDRELIAALRNASLVARWVAPSSDEGLHPSQVIEIWEVEKSGTSVLMLVDCDTPPSLVCLLTSRRPIDAPPAAAPQRPSPSPSAGRRRSRARAARARRGGR